MRPHSDLAQQLRLSSTVPERAAAGKPAPEKHGEWKTRPGKSIAGRFTPRMDMHLPQSGRRLTSHARRFPVKYKSSSAIRAHPCARFTCENPSAIFSFPHYNDAADRNAESPLPRPSALSRGEIRARSGYLRHSERYMDLHS